MDPSTKRFLSLVLMTMRSNSWRLHGKSSSELPCGVEGGKSGRLVVSGPTYLTGRATTSNVVAIAHILGGASCVEFQLTGDIAAPINLESLPVSGWDHCRKTTGPYL